MRNNNQNVAERHIREVIAAVDSGEYFAQLPQDRFRRGRMKLLADIAGGSSGNGPGWQDRAAEEDRGDEMSGERWGME